MLTRHIIDVLKKSTGAALITTTTVVGAVGLYSSITNASTSIPEDGDECLDVFTNLKQQATARVLWSLLSFAPGFLFGALYFLCRLPESVCPDLSLEYSPIEDSNQNSCFTRTLDEMSKFFHAVVFSDKIYKAIFKAIIAGLSVLGFLYGIVTVATTDIDKDLFVPKDCQNDLRSDITLDLTLSLIILVMISGPILVLGLNRNCSSKNNVDNNHDIASAAEADRDEFSLGRL